MRDLNPNEFYVPVQRNRILERVRTRQAMRHPPVRFSHRCTEVYEDADVGLSDVIRVSARNVPDRRHCRFKAIKDSNTYFTTLGEIMEMQFWEVNYNQDL